MLKLLIRQKLITNNHVKYPILTFGCFRQEKSANLNDPGSRKILLILDDLNKNYFCRKAVTQATTLLSE